MSREPRDTENRISDLLAALGTEILWLEPLIAGEITIDDISNDDLMAGLARMTFGVGEGLRLAAREIDVLRDEIHRDRA